MLQFNIEDLRERLNKPLPGIDAQMKMMPKVHDRTRFDLNNRSDATPGGVLILIYPNNNELYIPMMLRPEYSGAHSGQISFPGGRKENEDESLTHTALRESREELGIPENKVEILGTLTELFIIASNFTVLPTVGYLDFRPEFVPDPREVVEVIESPLSILLSGELIKLKTFTVGGGHRIEAPYYDMGGHHVWGATAMILSEFLTIFKDL